MTEGVAQDGKASSVPQDMGKVLLGHIHRKWLFRRSVPDGLLVGNSKKASFARDPRKSGTRDERKFSDRDAVGGRVAALGCRPD